MSLLQDALQARLRDWAWRRYQFGNQEMANEFVDNIERLLSDVVLKHALRSSCFVLRQRVVASLVRD